MASETSELTFVRCQTCRSLVPASASRCRICNATLEAASKSGSAETPGAGARVRQKTVSASAEEVAGLVAEQSPPPSSFSSSPAATPSSIAAEDDGEFDPLGAYLQDLDSTVDPLPTQASTTQLPDGENDKDAMDDDLYDAQGFDGEFLTDSPQASASENEALVQRQEVIKKVEAPPVETRRVIPPQSPPSAKPAQESKQVKPEARAPQADKAPQRDRVQPQKMTQPPMRPKVGGSPQQQQPRQEKPQQAPGQPNRGLPNDRNSGNNQGFSGPRSDSSVSHKPQAQQQKQRPRDEERDVAERQESQRPATQNAPRPSKIAPGRLFGWLVSYENPDGRAIELRAGKFFITGSAIRGSDLILEDHSISTPHALVAISDKGFMLQDLMSERGTFVRSAHDTQYRREEGIIEVQHGDWIRFGDVEFLVTIVPRGDLR